MIKYEKRQRSYCIDRFKKESSFINEEEHNEQVIFFAKFNLLRSVGILYAFFAIISYSVQSI